MGRHVISVLVSNHPGVLLRVSGLFSRRGYNIDSITVGVTENPEFSRMTVVVTADEPTLEQIIKQLNKLFDVKKVRHLNPEQSTFREIALIKVSSEQGADLMNKINLSGNIIVDMGEKTVTIEVKGTQDEVSQAIKLYSDFGIVEIARTGMVALDRGDNKLINYELV
jgi:acetolactate synthase-1/3 small subunit